MKDIVRTKEKESGALYAKEFGVKNVMAHPRLVKVVVSVGTGRADKKKKEFIAERISRITGQHAVPRMAKKSIATYKTRTGDSIGVMVTLRGAQMYSFLDKLIHIALPRTRDFKGVSPKSIDKEGNLTMGITEHTIFPETAEDDVRDAFGLAVTFVSTAKNKKEAHLFFQTIGVPFREV
jgi:large subunit ribosomal protein L5